MMDQRNQGGDNFNQKLIQLSERMKRRMKENETYKIEFYNKIKTNSKH
jgi:hypothetical protein